MVKNPHDNAEDGLIPGVGRSPGEGNDNPLQYSYLKKSMERGGWRATGHAWGGKELKKTEHTFLLPTSKWTQAVQTHVVQGCSMNQSYETRSAYAPRFLPPSSHVSSSHTLKNNTLCMIYCFPNSSVTLLIY